MPHSDDATANTTPLSLLGVDALVFWLRNQTIFWMLVLPIAGLAAAVAWLLATDFRFAQLRNHWGWDFLFALIYAMFLDRWMKETLLDDASPCEEVHELRRSIIGLRFLVFTTLFFLLALTLGMLRLQGIEASFLRWGVPHAPAIVIATMLTWLPHLFVWSALLAPLVLMMPSWAGIEPLTMGQAWALGRRFRRPLFALVFGAVLASFGAYALTVWAVQVLPHKPWAPAAMAATLRLWDCLLLALAGHVLAALWRDATGWRQPEPADHPFRDLKLRPQRLA
ncbi:MAG TPA: hypothetical protein VMI56_01740 [Reyranella sp.]|nr:hypothetical protein [Reyranella sp.]